MQAQNNLLVMLKLMEDVQPMKISLDFKSSGSFELKFSTQVQLGRASFGHIEGLYSFNPKTGFKFRATMKGKQIFSSSTVTPQMVFGAYRQALQKQNLQPMNQNPRRKSGLYVFIAVTQFYLKLKGEKGFELFTNLANEFKAVDKYTGLVHDYRYSDRANNETFLCEVGIVNGRGEHYTTYNAEQFAEYVATGRVTTKTMPDITPLDNSLHAVVTIVRNTIYSKWYVLTEVGLKDVSTQVSDSVRNYNRRVDAPHQKIPYMMGNGYVCYAFGCGLTHYLQQDNMNTVIPSIRAARLRVWTTEELNVPKDVHDFQAYLLPRITP